MICRNNCDERTPPKPSTYFNYSVICLINYKVAPSETMLIVSSRNSPTWWFVLTLAIFAYNLSTSEFQATAIDSVEERKKQKAKTQDMLHFSIKISLRAAVAAAVQANSWLKMHKFCINFALAFRSNWFRNIFQQFSIVFNSANKECAKTNASNISSAALVGNWFGKYVISRNL